MFVMSLDLSSFKSIRDFVAEFDKKEKRLDILINNAGVMGMPLTRTKEGLEMQIGVNHFGHFLLTNLLLPKIKVKSQKLHMLQIIFHKTFKYFTEITTKSNHNCVQSRSSVRKDK